MTKRIFDYQGHPEPSSVRFCHALVDSYTEGARSVGAEARRVDIGQPEFPLLRTKSGFDLEKSGTPESLIPSPTKECRNCSSYLPSPNRLIHLHTIA